ncbi:hypothetical protein [Mesorhizobium sp. M7A.F.Ca.MR.362.00.0.0]|uniref:hypothetical protein n=1 Tax=Mesorhizobium sp. M7A.F.Ca.MR.362.00.0.0 TaxID=2496779 RepID=UPI000FD3F425|nr:hypothetical protein [Mesorhizobium sp. M7A.F.Ca.MR.362.00.0.0]RUU80478.1 hypothetical protein EOC06_12045 [Mesorhizobium sp. M7A.F.Ca.MR.362.00.0.0]
MAKKPDKPVYSFIRKGNVLMPEMGYDLRALDGVANGQRVRIEVKEWRNLDRLRAYWSLLHEAVASTGMSISAEKLHEVIKLETGLVDLVRLPNGMTVAIPSSIALDKMGEPEFIAFFQSAEEFLARVYGFASEREQAA